MSDAESGTNTVTSQYVGMQVDSKDTVIQAYYNPGLFAQSANGVANFWFIEGDEVYTSSPNCKVIYTDYTLTSAPQAPQSYLHAVVAGAVANSSRTAAMRIWHRIIKINIRVIFRR